MSQTNTNQNALTIGAYVGAGIAFIGSFLNWGSLKFQGETHTVSGMDADGVITLICALVAAGLLVAGMLAKKAVLGALAAVPGLVILVFCILNMADSDRLIRAGVESDAPSGTPSAEIDKVVEAFSKMGDTSPSIGLFAVLLGGLVVTVCPLLFGLANRGRQ